MRFVDEYRDPAAARALVAQITDAGRRRRVQVHGGVRRAHAHHLPPRHRARPARHRSSWCTARDARCASSRWAGWTTPSRVAKEPGVIFTSFGDMMRVPGSQGNLLKAKAEGADVRFVYSPLDALRIAVENPDRDVVFFAVGLRDDRAVDRAHPAAGAGPRGDELQRVLQPRHDRPAAQGHPRVPRPAPGRVPRARATCRRSSASGPTGSCPPQYGKPLVTAGFEPLDILQAIAMLLTQIREGRCEVENQYSRVVREEGNPRALAVLAEVFELRPHFEWRGLGFISQSALKLRPEFADFDAELRYEIPGVRVADPKACQCGEVLKGVIKPWECKVFGTACTPETPIGTCMVSSEGACAAYYNFGRMHREAAVTLGRRSAVRRHDRRLATPDGGRSATGIRVTGVVQGVGFRPVRAPPGHRARPGRPRRQRHRGRLRRGRGPPDRRRRVSSAAWWPRPRRWPGRPASSRRARRADGRAPVRASSRARRGARRAPSFRPDVAVCDDCLAELFDPADRRVPLPVHQLHQLRPPLHHHAPPPLRPAQHDHARLRAVRGLRRRSTTTRPTGASTPSRWPAPPADRGSWFERTGAPGRRARAPTPPSAAAQAALAARRRSSPSRASAATTWPATPPPTTAVATAARPQAAAPTSRSPSWSRDLSAAAALAHIEPAEAAVLRRPSPADRAAAPPSGRRRSATWWRRATRYVGVLLPYTPLHHLLFATGARASAGTRCPAVLVMTSGNLSDEPICYEDDDARHRLGRIADAWLVHDRPIHVPCDDSVVRVERRARSCPLRRSRGYAPLPVRLPFDAAPTLAAGGELKNTFCLASGHDAWMSQHIGDMGSVETLAAFERSARQFAEHVRGTTPSWWPPTPTPATRPGGGPRTAPGPAGGAGPAPPRPHRRGHGRTRRPGGRAGHRLRLRRHRLRDRRRHLGRRGPGRRLRRLRAGRPPALRAAARRRRHHPQARTGPRWPTCGRPASSGRRTSRRCAAASARTSCRCCARQLERGVQCVPDLEHGPALRRRELAARPAPRRSYEAQAAIELEWAAEEAVRRADRLRAYRFELDGDEIDAGAGPAAHRRRPCAAARAAGAMAAGFHAAVARLVADVAERSAGRAPASTSVALSGGVFQNVLLLGLARAVSSTGTGLRGPDPPAGAPQRRRSGPRAGGGRRLPRRRTGRGA